MGRTTIPGPITRLAWKYFASRTPTLTEERSIPLAQFRRHEMGRLHSEDGKIDAGNGISAEESARKSSRRWRAGVCPKMQRVHLPGRDAGQEIAQRGAQRHDRPLDGARPSSRRPGPSCPSLEGQLARARRIPTPNACWRKPMALNKTSSAIPRAHPLFGRVIKKEARWVQTAS